MRGTRWCAAWALVLGSAVGCASPEKDVLRTWDEYRAALDRSDVAAVRSLLATGAAPELDGAEGAMALEMRSALAPADPAVTGVEVSALRAAIDLEGAVDDQVMTGRVTFTKEAGSWKVVEEEWTVDLSSAFPVPHVDLARVYAAGPGSTPQEAAAISAHEGAVTALAFTRDGQYLVSIGYDDYTICLWNPEGGALDRIETDSRPCDLALHPNGTSAYVVDTAGHVTQWPIDWGSFGSPLELAGLAGASPRIAVDAAGRRAVTTSWDDPAKLWDLETGSFVQALPHSERMRGVDFSPVGPTVACGHHGDSFAVWNLDRLSWPVGSRREQRVPKVSEQSDVWSVAFSPDGRRLATGHMDSSMSIWDMESGRQLHDWYLPDRSVMDVEFSPCGTVLATAQQDGRVHLWETETRRELARLRAHEGAARSVAFDPADGMTIATGGDDGVIRVWR